MGTSENALVFAAFFYPIFIILLGLVGASSLEAEGVIAFPTFPEIPVVGAIPLFGTVLEFIIFAAVVGGWFIEAVSLTFTDLIPGWVSAIIFTPLALIVTYEVTARLFRGAGS